MVGSVSSDKGPPQGEEWAWWCCPPPHCSLWLWNFRPEALLGRPPRTGASCFLMCFPHHLLITFGIVMCRFSSLPLGGYLCLSAQGKGAAEKRALMRPTGPHTEREPAALFDLTHMVLLISANLSWGGPVEEICPDARKQKITSALVLPFLQSSPITGGLLLLMWLALLPHPCHFQLSNTGLCLCSCASLTLRWGTS